MRIRDISLPAWKKITMKKILIATFALLTALVMGLGATALCITRKKGLYLFSRCKSGIRLMLYVRNLWKISRDCVFLYCNEPRRLLHACMQKSLFGDC